MGLQYIPLIILSSIDPTGGSLWEQLCLTNGQADDDDDDDTDTSTATYTLTLTTITTIANNTTTVFNFCLMTYGFLLDKCPSCHQPTVSDY